MVAATYGLAKMIPLAGVPTLIPDLVGTEHLNAANALEMLSYGVGSVAGAALAGAALAVVAPGDVLALDAASFLVFAGCLRLMKRLPTSAEETSDSISVTGALRFIVRCGPIRTTTLMFAACNIGLGVLTVLIPIYAVKVLDAGASGFGAMSAAAATGELIGAAVAGAWPVRRGLGRAIAATQLATAPARPCLRTAADGDAGGRSGRRCGRWCRCDGRPGADDGADSVLAGRSGSGRLDRAIPVGLLDCRCAKLGGSRSAPGRR